MPYPLTPAPGYEILLYAKVVGGLQMVDRGEADDKIIAVLLNDDLWSSATDINDIPEVFVERLRHYFLTYKLIPGEAVENVTIDLIFGADHAHEVIRASLADYDEEFESE